MSARIEGVAGRPDKEQRLEQEDQYAPERDGLQPRRGILEEPRGLPALVEAVGDDGQDARDVQNLLGEDVDGVGDQDGEGDQDRGVPQPGQLQQGEPGGETGATRPRRPVRSSGCFHEKAPVTTARTATRKATRPVPSLTRLSPPTTVPTRSGHAQPAEDSLGRHGVGGGGSPRDEGRGPRQPRRTFTITATAPIVASTSPTASNAIGLRVRSSGEEERPPSSTGG